MQILNKIKIKRIEWKVMKMKILVKNLSQYIIQMSLKLNKLEKMKIYQIWKCMISIISEFILIND